MAIGAGLVFSLAAAEAPVTEREPRSVTDYRIGIEDILLVSVWGEPALNLSVRVRPDGRITFPLVNDLEVVGQTPTEVRQAISTRLSKFINEPNVTVIVDQINSFKVYILGEVGTQGVLQIYRPIRLLQAIAQAGGFSEFSKQQVTVLRDKGPVESRILVNVKRLVGGDVSQENLFLQPGDTVVVD